MKFRNIIITALATIAIANNASAQQDWLHVRGTKTVESTPVDQISDISFTGNGSLSNMQVRMSDGSVKKYNADDVVRVSLGYNIPEIRITTDDPTITDVKDKINYLPATFNMKANGYPGAQDVSDLAFQVRGRGNSTMNYPKKPYRLKFAKKTELHDDMRPAKNYALIANYIDNTLMRNTTAFTIAQLLEMPYTNHSIPCDVYFNDRYVGSYMLTEKVGINSGHMYDINDEEGIFFEMDTYYDETYKFKSEVYNLPMMVKDPDLDELVEDGLIANQDAHLKQWSNDWNKVERVLSGREAGDVWDYIDLNSLVDYLIVYNVTNNAEISHPKSNYIHKHKLEAGQKYFFGSVWDFDWAYTYGDRGEGYGLYNNSLFDGDRYNSIGSRFYRALINTKGFSDAYKARWAYFKNTVYPELRSRMDKYADEIEGSAIRNFEIWPQELVPGMSTNSNLSGFRNAYNQMWTWLDKRIAFLDTAPSFGFFVKGAVSEPTEPDFTGLQNLNDFSLSIALSDMHPGDGQGLRALLDDDLETYHHSNYRDNSLHDPVYGSYVDWHLVSGYTTFGIEMSSRVFESNIGCPIEAVLYGSTDGKTWEKITDITNITSVITQAGTTGRFGGTWTKNKSYTYIRFSVTKAGKGSLLETSNKSGVYTYWNASSLALYGK